MMKTVDGNGFYFDKLDLGSFNQCIDYIEGVNTGEYSVPSLSTALYYSCESDEIARISGVVSGGIISVPTFEIGDYLENSDIDDPGVIESWMALVGLKIYKMLHHIIKVSEIPLRLDNICIPVKEIRIFNDDYCSCYGWIQLGIALIIPEEVDVDVVS
ncbi:hypothetical protein LCGC14_2509310 [marine sediment metagenome]|uniref:Uncharacterized protein n=1 Tax=marine sediment metagenome TaxID=412755 RepID=A0A0F9B0A0_9ZZZZ